MLRISTTTLESFRLWSQPEQDWMTEDELIATIRGEFVPNHKVKLGLAFGQVLESPEKFRVSGGYQHGDFFFSLDMMAEPLAGIDRRGVCEAKAEKVYGDGVVVAKADHLLGAELTEFKTTLSSFDADKYAESCQWRFMADIFDVPKVQYRVFCLSEDQAGILNLRSIEPMNLYRYPAMRQDLANLLHQFVGYVTVKGLDGVLRERQSEGGGVDGPLPRPLERRSRQQLHDRSGEDRRKARGDVGVGGRQDVHRGARAVPLPAVRQVLPLR